jgi:hypothetical protein
MVDSNCQIAGYFAFDSDRQSQYSVASGMQLTQNGSGI